MTRHVLLTLCVLAFGLVFTTPAQDSGKLVIQGARIIPVVGEEIDGGSILIVNGKISAIGKDIQIPFDAQVIDATGKVVMPGAVESFTSSGLDFANENVDVGAFLQVADALDPADRFFEEALRNGILTIHVSQGLNCVISGVSRVVRPIGISVQEMTVRAEGGLVVAFAPKGGYDRAAQMAVLRGAFTGLDRYLDRLAEQLYEEDLKKKGEEVLVGPAEARKLGRDLVSLAKVDDANRNLLRLRQGRLDAYMACLKAMDIQPALDLAKSQSFLAKSTLLVGSETYKVASALKTSGRPVVLPASQAIHREKDRMSGEDVETYVPRVFFDKKVSFAIADSTDPWYEAARMVRNGVSRAAALEAITLNAARAIGLETRLGSLEKGKDGTLVILSGDPLDGMTVLEQGVIEGRLVYERSKDRALRHLIQGIQDTQTSGNKAADSKPSSESSPSTPASNPATPASQGSGN